MTVPFQIPETIVPIVAREEAEVSPARVVIVGIEVVPTSIVLFRFALYVVGKSARFVAVEISVKAPKIGSDRLLSEKLLAGRFIPPTKITAEAMRLIAAVKRMFIFYSRLR